LSDHHAQAITELVGGELVGPGDLQLNGVSDFDEAKAGQLTLIGSQRYADRWLQCPATVAVVTLGLNCPSDPSRALIYVDDADLALSKALALFAPPPVHTPPGIHPSTIIHPSAKLGQEVRIGPHCLIGPGVVIGDHCILHNNVTILDDTRIGNHGTLWTGVVIRDRCTLGDRCILHPNAVIGADGFGYRPETTDKGTQLVKVPQIGTVTIGNDVEIGACATIDRAKCNTTLIGDGCKIDNHVQIGHNCQLGRMVVISGCTGIGGSTVIGDGTVIGGMAAIKDHANIGPGVQLAGGAQVATDLPGGAAYAGTPARPIRETFREVKALKRLPDLLKQLRRR